METQALQQFLRELISGDAQRLSDSLELASDEPRAALTQQSSTMDTCTGFAVYQALFLPLSCEFKGS